ncbi:Acid-sensing ion channel 2 [Collichthys lucidus]|uniref:Acid-sensing ion channel 2 n=1 Tax=Collichthys lucidus TaxID=240159 RepID=A0A4U5VU78_COLLU|nr:Acid-sensing ion channel 2 [Collichthys lucidus]
MWAPAPEAWLGNEAFPAAVGALWAAMALEGRCLRRGSPAMIRKGRQRRRTKPTLARVTSTLLSRTRLHGLRHVCIPGGSVGRRAFWLLAFCTSLGLLLSWSSNRLLHWLSFPTYTRVHAEWAKELAFPAVTICNNNPIRLYKLTKSDLYFAGHWLGLLLANRTVRPMVLDLLQEDRQAWFTKLSDFRLFLPPRNFEGTNLEFMDRLSHQLDDMLLSCKYRGEPCGAHNFSSHNPRSHLQFLRGFVICRPRRLKVTAELTAVVAVPLKDRYFLPLKGVALDRGQGKDMRTGAILIGGDSFLNALTKPAKIQKVEHGPEQKSGRIES